MAIPQSIPHRILVAPLDWGLGHATRMMPVIRQLIANGSDVYLAGEGRIKSLLTAEFPQLPFLELKGYRVKYGKTALTLPLQMLRQIPRLLKTIEEENQWLHQMQEKYRFAAVISDNRYGLHHAETKNIFITHQLTIKAPHLFEPAIQKLNYLFIRRFHEVWVPDHAGADNLGGELSHPKKMPPIPLHYLGPLSRFTEKKDAKGNDLLVLLTGPEPQRTILEKVMFRELLHYKGKATVLRGLPGETTTEKIADHITVYNHLPAVELEALIHQSALVISRSGYSTVMDLARLKKKSILIPTPGQTEQEYLAAHLMKKNLALCIQQNKFRLQQALYLAEKFPYRFINTEDSILPSVLGEFLKTLG